MFDLEQLINVVREERMLWDKRNKNYRNRLLTKRAWKEVAKTLGCSKEEAQSKWKNLRDSFCRELKKVPDKRSGAENQAHISEWVHFESLQFLRDVIKPRAAPAPSRRRRSLPDPDNMDDESAASVMSHSTGPSSNADNHTYIKSELDSFSSAQYEANENTERTDSFLYPEILLQKYQANPLSDEPKVVLNKNIKQENYTAMLADLERQKLELLKKEREYQEDEDISWFKSILPHMRTLPPLNKFMFRTKVQEMLLGELAKLNAKPETSTNQNTQSTSSGDLPR